MNAAQRSILGLVVLLAVTDLQTVAAIAPSISEGLGTEAANISYSLALFAVSAVTACVFLSLGILGRRPGRTLRLAASLYGIAVITGSLSQNIEAFAVLRCVAGFAGGMISALAITLAAKGSDYSNRGRRMSLISFGYFAAPLMLVPLSILTAGVFGWRSVMAGIGIALFAASLFLRPHGERSEAGEGISDVFKGRQRTERLAGVVGAFFVSGALVGFTSYLGIWLNELLRSDSGRISLAYAAINLCAFAAGTSGGFVADRYGKRRITLAATIVMAAGFAGIAAVSSSIASLVFTAAVIFGASLRNAPLNAIVTSLVPAGKTPGYVAARNIASQTGIGFAILVSGILYSSEGIEFVAVFCGLLTAISFAILRLIPELEGRRFDTAEIKIGAAPAYGNGS